MKKTTLALILAALAVAAYAVWMATRPELRVETIQPRVGTIREYVEEQAVTELPTDYLVAMPIAGWLEPITLREGDRVAAGQVVARLDTDDLQDRVEQSRARIARLETEIAEIEDHRLEENALTQTEATVVAISQMVDAAEAKLAATLALRDFAADEVERLEVLAERDAAALRELRAATTELKRAEAEYRGDQLELAALKTIEAVSYIGPKFIRDYIDRKQFTRQTRIRELEEARIELEIAQRNLTRAAIESPVDGVVLARMQTRRQYLAAGTPLLTIGRLEELEVIAEVLSEQVTRVRIGDPVEIFGRTLHDGPVPGVVKLIYPAGFTKVSSLGVEQQRVNVAIGLERRPEYLGAEFRVYVRIFYAEADDALILPRTALVRSPRGQWQALVVRDGRIEFATVQVGLMNDREAQIVSGLAPDARVVARPSADIEAGARVEAVAVAD